MSSRALSSSRPFGRLRVLSLGVAFIVGLAFLTGLVGAPSSAAAKGRMPHRQAAKKASKLWQKGLARHTQEDWDGAVALWTKAYALDPLPQYLWALARDEHRAGMLDLAKKHYLAFIAIKDVPANLKDQIAALRAEAAQHLVEIEVAKRSRDTAPSSAPSTSAPEGAGPSNGGATSKPPEGASATLADNTSQGLNAHREQASAPDHTLTWALVGGGAALLAGGGGVTAWGMSAASDMQKYSSPPTVEDGVLYRSKYDQAKSSRDAAAATSYVLYGVGAAAIVTGAVLFFTGDSPDAPAADDGAESAAAAPSSLSLAPWLSPRGAGCAMGLRW